jgi:hypothetical protein
MAVYNQFNASSNSMTIDFIYLPLVYDEGNESPAFPGMLVRSAHRTAHRHRREDFLALLLSFQGEHRYTVDEINILAEQAADIFFGAQGSVTRALQEMTEWVNGQVLDRNMDRGYEGIHAAGSLNAAILHKGRVFISQFGRTTTFLITHDLFEEFGRSEGMAETLGQSKRIQTRFYQTEIQEENILLMTADPPESWNGYQFAGITKLTKDQLKRRLLNQVTGNLEALVIRMKSGNGRVVEESWESAITEEPQLPKSEPGGQVLAEPQESSLRGSESPQIGKEQLLPNVSSADKVHASDLGSDEKIETITVKPGETARPIEGIHGDEKLRKNKQTSSPDWQVWLARRWMNLKTMRAKMLRIGSGVSQKIYKSTGVTLQLSPIILIFLSVAIPLVIILSSWMVYQRTGKRQQFEIYLTQALETADLARTEKELMAEYDLWSQTFEQVQRAEVYDTSSDSRALFEQAQFRMDEMDLAARLDFRPALTDFFPEGVVIRRIQSGSSGVYLLDATSGNVLRAFLNSKGFYEVDNEFQCAPGPYGLEVVTKIVDFVTLPANDGNYKIMAIDAQGNLLYCRPGEFPDSRTLSTPTGGWGKIVGIAYDDDVLYVLDVENEKVWMFAGKDPDRLNVEGVSGIVFSESPIPFFDEKVPDLSGGIDLEINQEDLYILHEDGHMTQCRHSSNKDLRLTSCEDPVPYTDNRVGRETKNPWIFLDVKFSMMEGAKLPSSSLLILDDISSAIYQFSFQLNLEKTLKVQPNRSYPVPDRAPSGFGLTSDMEIFLAFDNQLFIAALR